MKTPPLLRQIFLTVAVTLLAAASSVSAATFNYTNTTSNSAPGTSWFTGTNWSPAPLSASDTTLTFSGNLAAAATIFSNNDIAGNFQLNALNINYVGPASGTAPALTLNGNALRFVSNSGTAPTLSLGMTGNSRPTVTINNNLQLDNTLTVVTNSSISNATFTGIMSGSGGFTKSNPALINANTITLTGANNYTGATTVNNGVLLLQGANGAIGGSTALNVNAGANLSLNNATNNNNDRLSNSGTITLSGSTLTLTGNGATASTTEAINTLAIGAGLSTVNVTGIGTGQLQTLAVGSGGFSRTNAGTLNFINNTLQSAATNASRITINGTSGTGVDLVGSTTSNVGFTAGTNTTLNMVPYFTTLRGTAVTSGGTFLTYDVNAAGGLRPLASAEFLTWAAGYTTPALLRDNMKLNGSVTLSTAANVTINSMIANNNNNTLTGQATSQLTVNSGAIMVAGGNANDQYTITGFSGLTLGNGTWNEGIFSDVLATNRATINVPINVTGGGGITKTGPGRLVLGSANVFTGPTNINSGTLAVNGSTTAASAVTVHRGGTLAGSGTVNGTVLVNSGGTLAPGNSPGTLTQGATTLEGGGNYNWQILDAAGGAGVGFDTINLTLGSSLTLNNVNGNEFAINLWSLSAIGPDVNGNALNFNNGNNYTWTLISTDQIINSFSADEFTINVAAANGANGFSNPLAGGSFSVGLADGSTDLVLSYTAVPEPNTCLLLVIGAATIILHRRARRLA